ncbi:MAG TPA: M3 family metallopeptidase, partial [Thermoanaerobaculia bacterium]|nr:M3 family metallopeptidase [Thermoanaerobaculia bacterium]
MSRKLILRLAALPLLGAAVLAAGAPPNPLLAPWRGRYGGLPPFDRVRVEHFKPALESAMAENLREIDTIAQSPAKPDFANTIAALERAGRTFNRVSAVYGVFGSTMSTPEFQTVEREMSPKLAEFGDKITQNRKLFERIATVYDARDSLKLTPEQKRLVWLDYTSFARAGAKVTGPPKERLSQINQRLATLYTSFSQNLLADEAGYVLTLETEADVAGLPDSVREAAASAAESRGQKGKWAILNTRSSAEPFLTYSSRRDLREKVWRTFYSRGDRGDAKDNKAIISEILKLRAERAKLLGYASYPDWRLENSMAKTSARALELMEAVWRPAVARVREEVADMQKVADQEGAGLTIEPWDYRYYAERVRKAKYDLDQTELTPYLQLDRMRDALFYTADRLFGLRFRPLAGIPVVQPDVRV